MALVDAGTFEYWMGDRQLWSVVAPKSGSTAEFDSDDWLGDRLLYDEYAKAPEEGEHLFVILRRCQRGIL